MQVNINVKGGLPVRQSVLGRTLNVVKIVGAVDFDMNVEIDGFPVEKFQAVARGFKLKSPGFKSVEITSPVDITVTLILSFADIDVNYIDGATITAKIDPAQLPLPVSNDHGATAGNPIYTAQAVVPSEIAAHACNAVTVTDVPVSLDIPALAIVAGAPLTQFIVRNMGPNRVGLVAQSGLGFGVNFDYSAVVLEVGDIWIETDAPNWNWWAVSDFPAGAKVAISTVSKA
jgi:hypothetical protein